MMSFRTQPKKMHSGGIWQHYLIKNLPWNLYPPWFSKLAILLYCQFLLDNKGSRIWCLWILREFSKWWVDIRWVDITWGAVYCTLFKIHFEKNQKFWSSNFLVRGTLKRPQISRGTLKYVKRLKSFTICKFSRI
jgi:hypothetical protein